MIGLQKIGGMSLKKNTFSDARVAYIDSARRVVQLHAGFLKKMYSVVLLGY